MPLYKAYISPWNELFFSFQDENVVSYVVALKQLSVDFQTPGLMEK